jgi:transcriptional regulator with XRE-family HTH domain
MNLFLLAQRIKALRKAQGTTLRQLSAKTGLTSSLLSKVENFRVTPSLPALARVAESLGIPMSQLVEGLDERPGLVVVRKGDRQLVERDRPGSKLAYQALAHTRPAKTMEPFIVEIPPGVARKQFLAHEGEEFLLVLAGQVRYEYQDETYDLETGDCIYADGAVKHRVLNCGDTPAEILIVFSGSA